MVQVDARAKGWKHLGMYLSHAKVLLILLLLGVPACRRHDAPAPPCSVHILAASEVERREIIRRFRDRNGADWRGVDGPDPFLDELHRFVKIAMRGEPVARTLDPEDEGRVRAFVRLNADILGIADAEVADLQIKPDMYPIRIYSVSGVFPHGRYEQFPSVARRVHLNVGLATDGSVVSYMDLSSRFPPFDICTKPRLKPGDPALLHEVVGRTGITNVGVPELTFYVQYVQGISRQELTITLAYVFRIGGSVDIFVDAQQGRFLGEQPLYVE